MPMPTSAVCFFLLFSSALYLNREVGYLALTTWEVLITAFSLRAYSTLSGFCTTYLTLAQYNTTQHNTASRAEQCEKNGHAVSITFLAEKST